MMSPEELAQHQRECDAMMEERLDDELHFTFGLVLAYSWAIGGYTKLAERCPGRATAAANAIRSLQAALDVARFDAAGIEPPKRVT